MKKLYKKLSILSMKLSIYFSKKALVKPKPIQPIGDRTFPRKARYFG